MAVDYDARAMKPRTPEDAMRGFLMGADPGMARSRRVFRRLPSAPHCKLCAAPFEGPAGAVLRHVGFGRFSGNPAICNNCIKSLNKVGVYGAEIPVSLLFADIRGSTGIAEHKTPTEYRAYVDRFYRLASKAILDHDGIVDKFVGDEAIGLFFAGVSGADHAGAAIAAARALLDAVGSAGPAERDEAIPVGAAVHTGDAFVGSTETQGAVNDFTALGDVVNTTARLASEAGAGELLVSEESARVARLDVDAPSRRTIAVRGRSDPITVIALPPGQPRR
jgi:adenylate cyclase